MGYIYRSVLLLGLLALQACKHPLAIEGDGDIIEINGSGRGCTLEQYRAQERACTDNEVTGAYNVNYKAAPRPGWRFVEWRGPCAPRSDFQHCRLQFAEDTVDWWDQQHADVEVPPSTAVFQPIVGETGYLLAGTPVAGVEYETDTQNGVTSLDGSFQYENGETVRFKVGDTVIGEVRGKGQVTPFDLAHSAVVTGIGITWALQDQNDPFHTVINLAVFLHSLDDDGVSDNGIVIRPGVASLLDEVALNFRKPWDSGKSGLREREDPYEPWTTFQTDPTFRHFFGRASRKHRFKEPHPIAEPSVTLEKLYKDLGIESKVVGMSVLHVSQPFEDDAFETLYYDDRGNITRHENTALGEAYENWLYNDQGRVTRHEQHASPPATSFLQTWQYDARGNVQRVEEHTERRDIRTYVYDHDDNLTQETFIIEELGTTNSELFEYSYEYDKRGRLQKFISTRENGIDRWIFNALGNPIHREKKEGTRVEIWSYNSDGNVTRLESDVPWSPETWEYNTDGQLIRYEQHNTFCDRGCYRLASTTEYDDNGRAIISKLLNLEDNAVLEVDTWAYDEAGRVVLRKGDPLSGDEIVTETWQYHSNGPIKRHAIDSEIENLEDQYDTRGNLMRESYADEFEQTLETWNYDVEGKLVYRSWDANNDGILDQVVRYQYTATGWAHLFTAIDVFWLPYRPPIKPAAKHEERPPDG